MVTDETPKNDIKIRRKKRRKRAKWRALKETAAVEAMLLLILTLAFLFSLNPFKLIIAPAPELAVDTPLLTVWVNNFLQRLAFGGGSESLAFICLVISLVGIAYRFRWRVMQKRGWYKQQCPHCGEAGTLKRMRRSWYHRFIGRFGYPIHPYICGVCHWQGTRLDESRI